MLRCPQGFGPKRFGRPRSSPVPASGRAWPRDSVEAPLKTGFRVSESVVQGPRPGRRVPGPRLHCGPGLVEEPHSPSPVLFRLWPHPWCPKLSVSFSFPIPKPRVGQLGFIFHPHELRQPGHHGSQSGRHPLPRKRLYIPEPRDVRARGPWVTSPPSPGAAFRAVRRGLLDPPILV